MSYEPIDKDRIVTDDKYKAKLKRLCQTDLFFLTRYALERYKDVTERTHNEVAKFFVHKDPDIPLKALDKIKRRLLLMPRGTFKTTFNICDTVQWIICYPDLAIMVMTAANNTDAPLADAFVDEVASHFYESTGSEPTAFRLLFPEFVIRKMPKAGWFETPAREQWRREPTLMGVSIEQSLSGWHFDVAKIEDIQDNRNSQTTFGIKKVKQNLYVNLKMVMSWGYREMTGTRYGPTDVYSDVIENLNPKNGKLMWKPAMEVKEEVFKRQPKLRAYADDYAHLFSILKKDDWKLFFPEFLPYQSLIDARDEDEASFMTQQMNIALGNFKPLISKERLLSATLAEDQMPITGAVHIAWRFETEESPFAAGAVGVVDEGRLFIMEVVRGQYSPSRLAEIVVDLAKRHHCETVKIAGTPGAHHMEHAIRNEAIREVHPLNIVWTEHETDERERSLRIKSAEPIISTGRLFFSSDIPNIKEVHKQLYLYGRVEEIEIADIVSRLCKELPGTIQRGEDGEAMDNVDWELLRQRDQHDKLYGLGSYATPEPTVSEADDVAWEPEMDSSGLETMMPGLES